jgi:hypothetical protein
VISELAKKFADEGGVGTLVCPPRDSVRRSEMKVTVWASSEKKTLGIRVGKNNRDQFFSREWKEVFVDIDGTLHTFSLTNGFWNKCPEFRDRGKPVIKEWLMTSNLIEWRKGSPPRLILETVGEGRFRLTF